MRSQTGQLWSKVWTNSEEYIGHNAVRLRQDNTNKSLADKPHKWHHSENLCFNSCAGAPAGPKEQKAFTLKRYIRATSPVNTYSSGVKTDFRRKTGRRGAVYESIRKIPTPRTT